MTEEMAIIKDVSFGCRDTNQAALWFTVETIRECALQRLSGLDAIALIEKYEIVNIRNIEGKPCICDVSDHCILFKRLMK
jgi:hypothetical protein